MKITKQLQKDINKVICIIAEGYFEKKNYDSEEDYTWEQSIDHAHDDFQEDVKGWMACVGHEDLTDEQANEISDYAWNNVNWQTIRDFT